MWRCIIIGPEPGKLLDLMVKQACKTKYSENTKKKFIFQEGAGTWQSDSLIMPSTNEMTV